MAAKSCKTEAATSALMDFYLVLDLRKEIYSVENQRLGTTKLI
jgi:hypothetical protein